VPHTCGGVPLDEQGALAFAEDVARVLDKNNENAIAVLHGTESQPLLASEKIDMWRDVGKAISEKIGLHATIALQTRDPSDPRMREFAGIILTKRPLDEIDLPLLESTVLVEPRG